MNIHSKAQQAVSDVIIIGRAFQNSAVRFSSQMKVLPNALCLLPSPVEARQYEGTYTVCSDDAFEGCFYVSCLESIVVPFRPVSVLIPTCSH